MTRLGRAAVMLALLVALVTLGRALLLFGQHAARAVAFPYQLNYGEGPLLDQTLRLAAGANIYHTDFMLPPYTVANYPPLFMLVQVPFVTWFGPSFTYGRVISLLSSVGVALLISLTVHTLTRDRLAALVSGLLWFALPYPLVWSPLNRIDTFALLWSWLALFVVVRWGQHRWGLALGVAALVAAACTRQTYLLAAPLALVAWLFFAQGRRLAALNVAFGTGTVVLLLFDGLLLATGGGLLVHLILANTNAILTETIVLYADEIARHMPVLLLLAGVGLLSGLTRPTRRATAWWLTAPYLLGGLAVALTIGKIGSDVNYLYELSAGLCLTGGVALAAARRLPLLRIIMLLALAWQVTTLQRLSEDRYYDTLISRMTPDRVAEVEALRDLLTDNQRVLTDEFTGLLPLAGQPLLFQPFELTQMAHDGIWDERPFLQTIAQGAYDLILIYQPARYPQIYQERWTPAMWRQINESYRPSARIGETTVFVPRD